MSSPETGGGHTHAWAPFYHTVEADKKQSPADISSRKTECSPAGSCRMSCGRTRLARTGEIVSENMERIDLGGLVLDGRGHA
jgi:hypothetical protein